jgi:hypothetical protein
MSASQSAPLSPPLSPSSNIVDDDLEAFFFPILTSRTCKAKNHATHVGKRYRARGRERL